jgi:lysophospholipase L1-like esterase
LLALLVALAFPAASRAGCGGTVTSWPASHVNGQTPPLAIGDSTMLLSVPGLAAEGYQSNAHGCRAFFQADQLLGQLNARHALPHMVVVALGANCCISAGDIAGALHVLGPRRLLVLVTPRQLGGGSGANAALERREAQQYPGRILLLDWVRYSAGHPSWFQPDGLHLTYPGVHGFTTLLATALPYAYEPCPPHAAADLSTVPAERRVRKPVETASAPALAMTVTLKRLGYIGVTVTGPSGTPVQLSERAGGGAAWQPLQTVQLGSGPTNLAHLVAWRCEPRNITLLAAALPPAPAAQVTATVQTPTCRSRLVSTFPRSGLAGHTLRIQVRDRWRVGSLPMSFCVTAPGGAQACHTYRLHPAETQLRLGVSVPRVGGWRVVLSTAYGQHWRKLIWVSHRNGRIRLLAAGDSEMQILDSFIGQDLAAHRVSVSSDARISTGLTNSFFFNWQTHARAETAALHQDATVIFVGANDGFAVRDPSGQTAQCCGSAWSAGYATLVAEMIRTFLQGESGRVYWFLLPEPRPANFRAVFHAVNSGIRQAAARFPGRVALVDADAFFTPGGRYRDYMTYHGQGFVIHEADGIHLSTASDHVAAELLARQLIADHIIR